MKAKLEKKKVLSLYDIDASQQRILLSPYEDDQPGAYLRIETFCPWAGYFGNTSQIPKRSSGHKNSFHFLRHIYPTVNYESGYQLALSVVDLITARYPCECFERQTDKIALRDRSLSLEEVVNETFELPSIKRQYRQHRRLIEGVPEIPLPPLAQEVLMRLEERRPILDQNKIRFKERWRKFSDGQGGIELKERKKSKTQAKMLEIK